MSKDYIKEGADVGSAVGDELLGTVGDTANGIVREAGKGAGRLIGLIGGAATQAGAKVGSWFKSRSPEELEQHLQEKDEKRRLKAEYRRKQAVRKAQAEAEAARVRAAELSR